MTQPDPGTSARDIQTLSEEHPTAGADLVADLYWHLVDRNGRGISIDEAREYVGRRTARFPREILRSWLDRSAPGPSAGAGRTERGPRGTDDNARGAARGCVDPPPAPSDRARRQSLLGQDAGSLVTGNLLSRAAGLGPAGLTNAELLATAAGTHAAGELTRPATPPTSGRPQPIETREVPRPRGAAPPPVTPSARLIVAVHLPTATVDQGPTDPRYEYVEETAYAAVRAWITHPAVGREVAAARSALDRLVEPLGLAEQWAITLVTARLLDIAGRYPDGSRWPDPFIEAPAPVVASARQIGPRFVEALSALAQRLAQAGVPLDPFDRSVLLVLAQLALLDIDVAHLTAEIVDDLNVLPPGWIDREWAERGHVVTGAGLHGRTTRFHAYLASIGEDVARDLSPLGAIHAPYAKGGRRESPSETIRLRAALASLAEQDPTLTPGTLLADVVGNEHPGLQQVRDAMGWPDGHVPELRRIERNWPKSRQ